MKINWKVRVKSIKFWLAIVPALLLLVQVVAVPFGYDFKIEPLNSQLIAIVNTVFVILSILGVITDPTTAGISDSRQALGYDKLKETK